MARVLVTRPLIDAGRLASRLRDAGHEAIVSPLLDVAPVEWALPETPFDAVLFTSRQAPANIQAVANAAERAAELFGTVPVFPIGPGTHAACVESGLANVRHHADGDLDRILADVIASGVKLVLWLSGEQISRDPTPKLAEHGISVTRRIVYRAALAERFTPQAAEALAQNRVDWALLLSPRTARRFMDLYAGIKGAEPATLSLGCISPQVAERVSGRLWRGITVADQPNEASLLAATMLLCNKRASSDPEGES